MSALGLLALDLKASALDEHIEAHRQAPVLDRPGQPEFIASALLFLASEEARLITGQTLYR